MGGRRTCSWLSACIGLGTESAFEVLARRQGPGGPRAQAIIHLEIGEPDFDTPPHIIEAACAALRNGAHPLYAARAFSELREAIAASLSATRGHEIDPPDQVVVTPGGQADHVLCAHGPGRAGEPK
jgi:aspartate aminotransferase